MLLILYKRITLLYSNADNILCSQHFSLGLGLWTIQICGRIYLGFLWVYIIVLLAYNISYKFHIAHLPYSFFTFKSHLSKNLTTFPRQLWCWCGQSHDRSSLLVRKRYLCTNMDVLFFFSTWSRAHIFYIYV